MTDYHNIVGLILIFVVIVSLIAVMRKVPKIDEGNKDIYDEDFLSIDDQPLKKDE